MEYLCFWVTRYSVKPVNNKIEAITNIKTPIYRKQVRTFMAVINCYRSMWTRRPYMSAPLTRLTLIKRKSKWTQVKPYAFNRIKRIVARNTLLSYTDFNETFKMHTDASAF